MAAFDFDGTLTSGGSVLPFLVSLRGFWPVLRAVVALSPKLLRSALVGGTAADDGQGGAVHPASRRPADRVGRRARRRLRRAATWPATCAMTPGGGCSGTSARGTMSSSSPPRPECYVRRAGELLGVDGVLATRLAVGGGGLLTGGYEGKNCRGAEKYARLVVHLRAHGLLGGGNDQPELWAYGNSRGDLRLLQCRRPRRRRRVARAPRAAAQVPPPRRRDQGADAAPVGQPHSARAGGDPHDATRVAGHGRDATSPK